MTRRRDRRTRTQEAPDNGQGPSARTPPATRDELAMLEAGLLSRN